MKNTILSFIGFMLCVLVLLNIKNADSFEAYIWIFSTFIWGLSFVTDLAEQASVDASKYRENNPSLA